MSSMAPEGGLEVLDLTDLVGDLEIPCDYINLLPIHRDGAARWVVLSVCPGCGHTRQMLTCSDCKDGVMAAVTQAGQCQRCDLIILPYLKFWKSIEPLDKRPL